MAVELRCPDCRAKLRLGETPDPGTDVECPECNAIFPAPDPDTGEVPDDRGERKAKKKKSGDEAPKKEAPKPEDAAKLGLKKAPKKRKAKMKETNQKALILVIIGAVLFLSLVIGLLVWFFSRKPASYEMMNYLPEDATHAVGLNIGHMHKYSEFIKVVEPSYKELGFQKVIEALARALGLEAAALPDYMVEGWGKTSGALVIRTKKEFDSADLKKLPGAQEGKKDGAIYYSVSPIPKLWGGAALKVFAPTKRLIVLCEYGTRDDVFGKMMTGNRDGDTLNKRLGPLGKRITRGTFWTINVLDTSNRPKAPEKKDDNSGAFLTIAASTASKARGMGFKASLGSRAVRFEVALWYEDSDVPSELKRKFKEDDLVKAQDDSSLDPPKWWKDFADKFIGDKKVSNELMTQFGATSSGDLFIVYSECDTKNLMAVLTSIVGKITGQGQGMMGPGGPGGPGGGPLGPGGPGGGAQPPMPGRP